MKEKKHKLLWISLCTPYKKIAHAGGQTFYHNVDDLLKYNQFDITVVSLCPEREYDDARASLADADVKILKVKNCILKYILNIESRLNPFHRYGRYLKNYDGFLVKRALISLSEGGYSPDLIILNWTEMIALIPFVKKIFPDVPCISIEEDVSFQRRKRLYDREKSYLKKAVYLLLYKNSLRKEISWLMSSELVVVYNNKDRGLLIDRGIPNDKIFTLVPYYRNMGHINYKHCNNDIIFWGAMWRPDNYEAAVWFIKNVLPKIEDLPIRFVVMGNKPPWQLCDYESEKIHITGFVQSPEEIFQKAFCMAAPLKMGAGIKVKILEGLSLGIPVITGKIGIEGIPAKDRRDYLLAETADEYAQAIRELFDDDRYARDIGLQGKAVIERHFKRDKNMELFVEKIVQLKE